MWQQFWVELLRETIVAGLAVVPASGWSFDVSERNVLLTAGSNGTPQRSKSRGDLSTSAIDTGQSSLIKETFLKRELIAEAAKELESCASDLRTAGFDVLPSSEDKAMKQLSTALSQIEAVVVVGRHVAVDSAKAAEPPAENALLDHLKLLDDAIAEVHASLEGSINAQLGFSPKANQQEKNGARMHRPSEGMRRLALVLGVLATFGWIIIWMVASQGFTHIEPRGSVLALIGIPICFGLGFGVIWAIDWVVAGFRQRG